MPKEHSNLRRDVLLGILPRLLYRIETGPQTDRSIGEIREILISRPDLNFILYFNHISYNDPLIAGHIVRKFDPHLTRHLIAPVSYSHSDPDQPVHRGFSFMVKQAEACGIEPIRIIQSYQVDNPEFGYTSGQAFDTYKQLLRRVKDLMFCHTPTGCIISPEGHRSDTGVLGEIQPGITTIGKLMRPVVYIPLGISYRSPFDRDSVNIGSGISVAIGTLSIQEPGRDSPTPDLLMERLAATLPVQQRGRWAESW